jgi:hypothetical protein
MVALVCLGSGAVRDVAVGPRAGKGSDELTLARDILDALQAGEILVARRLGHPPSHEPPVLSHLNGAKVGDLFMSLIHTAELHRVEPFDDLVALLRQSPAVALDPAAWMPWHYTATLAPLAAETTNPAPD